MVGRALRPVALMAALAVPLGVTLVTGTPARADLYALATPPSALEVGCFGMCGCAVRLTPTYGSFDLVYTGSDPLYANYDVVRYIASFNNGPGAVAIVGSGKYRIGGEFALVQQLTLDLEVWNGPVLHFDSGLVPVGATFPAINVSCAVHGFQCFDSVIVVDAKPADATNTGPPPWRFGLEATWPNPFTSRASIAWAAGGPGRVVLTVVDLAGRTVRTLIDEDRPSAGPGVEEWDGRADDGRLVPAGVYWARLRWPGGADRRRIIKLE